MLRFCICLISVLFALFRMSLYFFLCLGSFVHLTSLPLYAFAIGLQVMSTPFDPAPAVAHQQPSIFIPLFTGHPLFAYDTARSVAGRIDFNIFFDLFSHSPLSLRSVHCRPLFWDSPYKCLSPALAKVRQLRPPSLLCLHLILCVLRLSPDRLRRPDI